MNIPFVEVKFKDKDLARVTEYKVRVGVKVRHSPALNTYSMRLVAKRWTNYVRISCSFHFPLVHHFLIFVHSSPLLIFRLHKAHRSWIAIRMVG